MATELSAASDDEASAIRASFEARERAMEHEIDRLRRRGLNRLLSPHSILTHRLTRCRACVHRQAVGDAPQFGS